jgi:hypothetical protein
MNNSMTLAHQALLNLARLLGTRFPAQRTFNVFEALQLEHDEVRLHSRLITFLIDPRAHSHGAMLLHAFMQSVGIVSVSEEECRHARVVSEEGRVDILIEFGSKRAIVIENKIYAPDQERQLYRYWDQARRQFDEVHVLYLTLQGTRPSDDSLQKLDEKLQERYQNISYKYHISDWLRHAEECAVRLPHLRETISQYASVVDRLTGNVEMREYMNELVDLLLTGDNLRQARDIRAAYIQALVTLQERMWTELAYVANSTYPDMAKEITSASLSTDPVVRRERIERFYQPNARNRNYFGLYFTVPGFSHTFSFIEIEAGLYTGVYCPKDKAREQAQVARALDVAGIHGGSQASIPMWRRCALWTDLYEPEPATLAILNNSVSLREAAQASMAQVYEAWLALQRSVG